MDIICGFLFFEMVNTVQSISRNLVTNFVFLNLAVFR